MPHQFRISLNFPTGGDYWVMTTEQPFHTYLPSFLYIILIIGDLVMLCVCVAYLHLTCKEKEGIKYCEM